MCVFAFRLLEVLRFCIIALRHFGIASSVFTCIFAFSLLRFFAVPVILDVFVVSFLRFYVIAFRRLRVSAFVWACFRRPESPLATSPLLLSGRSEESSASGYPEFELIPPPRSIPVHARSSSKCALRLYLFSSPFSLFG